MYKTHLVNSMPEKTDLDKFHFEENGLLYVVPRNKSLLNCIMKTLCENDTYHVYLYDKKKTDCTNYLIKINEKTESHLNDIINVNIDFKFKNGLYLVNIIIADRAIKFDNNFYEVKNITEICTKMKSLSESNNFSNLIALERIIGIDFGSKLCVPNMQIKNNTMTVFNNKTMEKMCVTIKSELNEIYGIDLSLSKIQKRIRKCHEHGFDIYKGTPIKDSDIELVKKFHLDVKKIIYNKYCRNIDMLFDVGCGRLTDLFFWNEAHIKNVVCVEPSKDSIISGKERYEKVKNKIRTKINVIEGVGDDDWSMDEKYNRIFDRKYDVISFNFTIHYLIENMVALMKNILSISKCGTKIIINCMDGDLINNELNQNGKIEVRNKNGEIIFAINDADNDNILVYLKSGYGMENGSIEKIVGIKRLLRIFDENGFKLLMKKPFLEYDSYIKNSLSMTQKSISKYYISLILEHK